MPNPPNPITAGIRAIFRDPVIFLLEVFWRWSFTLLALILLFAVGVLLFGPLPIGNPWTNAWHSRDPRRIGGLAVTILILLGIKAVITAIAIPIVIALLWSVLSAVGRSITVRRLRT